MSDDDGYENSDLGSIPPPPHRRQSSQNTNIKSHDDGRRFVQVPIPPEPVTRSKQHVPMKKTQVGRALPPLPFRNKQPAVQDDEQVYDEMDDKNYPLPVPPRKRDVISSVPPLPTQPIPKKHDQEVRKVDSVQPQKQTLQPTSISGSTNDDDCESITLTEFVKQYSNALPLKIRVEEGYCGTEERSIISTGDMYNFHFIKNEKVVSIQDSSGSHFTVPLNSAVQFGLLYDPVNDRAQAVKGYSFKTIGDLASYEGRTPKIIRATKSYPCVDKKMSVEKDEVLIIKKIGRTAIKRKYQVRAFSLLTHEEKILYEECEGGFLTDPLSVRLYMTDIVDHFGSCLPLESMLFLNSDVTDDSLSHLVSEVITLTHISIESSIIATTCCDDENAPIPDLDDNEDIPVAIPIQLEIEVVVLGEESEDEELYQNTRDLFEHFDPLKIKNMGGASKSSSTFKKSVRAGYEYRGLEILKPSKVYDGPGEEGNAVPSHTKSTTDELKHVLQQRSNQQVPSLPIPPRTASRSTSPKPKSASIDLPPHTELKRRSVSLSTDVSNQRPPVAARHPTNNKPPLLPRQPRDNARKRSLPITTDNTYGNVELKTTHDPSTKPVSTASLKCATESSNQHKKANLEVGSKEVEGLKSEVAQLRSQVTDLCNKFDRLQNEVKQLKKSYGIQDEYQSSTSKPIVGPNEMLKHVEDLRQFTCEEIQRILENMNLGQYCKRFSDEQIDGEILAECDEKVLELELNISSVIHRAKLMKVITGKYSPCNIFEGQSPYVTLTK